MSSELENEFFSHFNVSDREKELLSKFEKFKAFIRDTKSLPFFLCSIKDCDGLKKCVDDGFDINTEINHESLLSIAIARNDDAIASYLFNNGFTIKINGQYLKYLLLSIKRDHKSVFDFLIKSYEKFSLSEDSANDIVRESLCDVHFISKIIEINIHIARDGSSMISDVVSHRVKSDVFELLIQKNLIETEKCNQFYSKTIDHWYESDQIERLKLLSPYCDKVEIGEVKSNSDKNLELIKFLLSDEKYSNYEWIVNYFSYRRSEDDNKTEILKFILDSNLKFELLNSIMFPVINGHNFLDLDVLLEFIDRFDANSLNRMNNCRYTVIHEILDDPSGNTAAVLERAIANGYDVNIASIQTDWDWDWDWDWDSDSYDGIKTAVPTLELFLRRISFSVINDENSKKIVYILLNHTSLSKELIDKLIDYFLKTGLRFDEGDFNFLKYLNSVYEGRSDCPSFFIEHYSDEILKNEYLNLLPQTAKDIFVFP